jgi:hypothetical protein
MILGGARIGKTFTLMIIIPSLLQFYFEQNRDLDPSKQTILKMVYIGKAAYNIGGSTIHS